jgi:hypothetical protein
MFNGYFYIPDPPNASFDTQPEEIDNSALLNISLVCTESHRAVLLRYPETITIYRRQLYPGANTPERRQVPCNPALDLLVVDTVPSYSSQQRHPSAAMNNPDDTYHEDLMKWFPQDAAVFANFRFIISRFRHVVFRFMHRPEGSTPLSSEDFHSTEFKQFIILFERLEHLYIWDQECLEGSRTIERVDNIEDRGEAAENTDLQSVVNVSGGILNCDSNYKDYVQAQSELSTDGEECCWVPTPKGFNGTWLFSSSPPFENT